MLGPFCVIVHISRMGLPDFGSTRPMRYASGQRTLQLRGIALPAARSAGRRKSADRRAGLRFPPGSRARSRPRRRRIRGCSSVRREWRPAARTRRAPGRKRTVAAVDLESHAAGQRHLARVADQAEAGHVRAAVHVEAQHALAGAPVQRQHGIDGGRHVRFRGDAALRARSRSRRSRCAL